ncbi:MAG TPA: protein translocase subunit SecD [Spirochaetia bacterium]|nr:protein translocase subunit SecD [Spirochaetia bacterium]
MKKRYRFLIILAVLGLGFYFVWPSVKWYFLTAQADKDMAESSRNQIKVYAQERADTAVKALLALNPSAPLPAEYSFLVEKAQKRYRTASKAAPTRWTVQSVLTAYTSRGDITSDCEAWYRDQMFALKDLKNQTMQLGLDLRGGMYVTIQVDYAAYEAANKTSLGPAQRKDKMDQTMEVLRNKIDQFGLTDPSIRTQGDDRIIIEIPGTSDPENVRRFIMGKGSLTFHIVDDDAVTKVREYAAQHPGVLLDAAGNVKDAGVLAVIPKGDVLRGVFGKDSYGLDDLKGYTVLQEEVGLNGTEITNAQVGRDPLTSEPTVNFVLTSAGGETFYKLTSANVGKRLAVALDDKVKAQATIQEPIRDQVRVNGFSAQEATDLALTLRTGSLPVPLEITSQQAIGASLGQDAINQGIKASVIGIGLVMLFMLFYYRRAGFNAVLSQVLHLYINVAILSVFGFTLTLAAIAGLVLTIGMSVDANVLIFERMKEESRLGKTTAAVISHGFSRAFSAILDSNVTTIIAALVLTQLGKGSIQGFAVTLLIGNLATLFAAVFVSRLIFDFELDVLRARRILLTWRKIA